MPSPDPTINTITLSNTLSVLPQLGMLVSYLKDGVTGFGQNETCRRHFFNVEIIRETTICIVTKTDESDVSDKQQHDGIGGKASVNVAIGGETSLNVAIGGETSATVAAVDNNFEQAAVSADRRSQHIMQPARRSGQRRRNITLLCTHMYTYTCNKADDHTQVPVLNCNNYRVIGITRLG